MTNSFSALGGPWAPSDECDLHQSTSDSPRGSKIVSSILGNLRNDPQGLDQPEENAKCLARFGLGPN